MLRSWLKVLAVLPLTSLALYCAWAKLPSGSQPRLDFALPPPVLTKSYAELREKLALADAQIAPELANLRVGKPWLAASVFRPAQEPGGLWLQLPRLLNSKGISPHCRGRLLTYSNEVWSLYRDYGNTTLRDDRLLLPY